MNPPDHPDAILERALWRAVDEIGRCWSTSVSRLSDDQLAAYVLGVNHTLVDAYEDFTGGAAMEWARQIRASLGEQLRRRHPDKPCCPGRKLNELLSQVRDWRIALVAGDDSMFAGPYRKMPVNALQDDLDRWLRREDRNEDEAMLARQIDDEIRALFSYRVYLTKDREWWNKREERLAKLAGAAAETHRQDACATS